MVNAITNAGNTAILQAITIAGQPLFGFQLQVASFRLGASNASFDPAAVSMPGGDVYISLPGQLTAMQTDDPNTVCYVVTLDPTVGGFTYGSVGLYLSTGQLLTYISLPEIRTKISTSLPARVGDVHIYYIPITVTNSNTVFSLRALNLDTTAEYAGIIENAFVLKPPCSSYLSAAIRCESDGVVLLLQGVNRHGFTVTPGKTYRDYLLPPCTRFLNVRCNLSFKIISVDYVNQLLSQSGVLNRMAVIEAWLQQSPHPPAFAGSIVAALGL